MNKKRIKLYTYHGKYMPIKVGNKNTSAKFLIKLGDAIFAFFYFVGLMILKISSAIIKFVFLACFHAGSIIVKAIVRTYTSAKNDFLETKGLWPRRFKQLFRAQYLKTLLMFFVIIGLAWAAVGSLHLIAKGVEIKNKIMRAASLGNSYLADAKDALAGQDFNKAQTSFALAYQTFTKARTQIKDSGEALNQLLNLVPQKRDADRLLEAASLIAQAGQDSINLEQKIKLLKLNASGITSQDGQTAQVFRELDYSLKQALDKLLRANNLVQQVDPNSLPEANRPAFADLKDKLYIAQFSLNNFKEVFALGQSLLLGDKNILILLENNNELRASGGFIGTFGNLKMHDGSISKINVSSVYDLDGQLKETIKPPRPILNLNTRWFLRDSNWFADFPATAKKISNFYEMESGETPDVVIALTPNIIVEWLKILGPINLPKYNVILSADNFVEQTQAITTLSNDLPTNEPKQILADLFPVLLQKISTADQGQWGQVIQGLQDSLSQKQIVLFSRNDAVQNQLAAFHWDGSLNGSDRDYLSVVSSNLGGTKTDLAIEQKINLTTTISDDGSITNELEITRTNKMPDLPQTGNDSYIRAYTPLGSKLLNNIGFDYKKLDYPDNQKYKIDSDVYNLEKNSVTDNLTGTLIGQESGKTIFANWLNLKGGETKTVKLSYQLPFKLSEIDRYSLLLQKQIGATNQNFNWTINFSGRQIAWKNFDTNSLNTSNLNSDIILNKDYLLGMVFQKR